VPNGIRHEFGSDDHGLLGKIVELPISQRGGSELARRLHRFRSRVQYEFTRTGHRIERLRDAGQRHLALLQAVRLAQVVIGTKPRAAINQVPCLRGSHYFVSLMHESELKRGLG
jgi:hypothetical protein